jgi:hypothetical protein
MMLYVSYQLAYGAINKSAGNWKKTTDNGIIFQPHVYEELTLEGS